LFGLGYTRLRLIADDRCSTAVGQRSRRGQGSGLVPSGHGAVDARDAAYDAHRRRRGPAPAICAIPVNWYTIRWIGLSTRKKFGPH